MDYILQQVFAGQNGSLSDPRRQESCSSIWDSATAQFSQCALPFISGVPLVVISCIAILRIIQVLPIFQKWRPNWTKRLVTEFLQEQRARLSKTENHTLSWSIALLAFSVIGLAPQIVKLKFLDLRLHAILLLTSWTAVALYITFTRPRSCPSLLLAYYVPAATVEFSFVDFRAFSSVELGETAHYVAGFAAISSIFVILLMPFRPASLPSDSISAPGSKPDNAHRSPEDNLRLWQFLCVSWITPLIAIGKSRQLQEEDVWQLAFEFQHRRLHEAFRQLRGSVIIRLLKANGIDCCILVLTAFVSLLCEMSSPVLLRQLLLAIEAPVPVAKVAFTYALISFALSLISAQSTMLATWFARRCYERSRGEMIMMVYEKALSRKVVVGLEKQSSSAVKKQNGSATKKDDSTANKNTGDESFFAASTTTRANKKDLFQILMDCIKGGSGPTSKLKQPATAGKILNLIRGDIYEVAQRLCEIEILIKLPFGLLFSVCLIWNFLGPSCLLGVITLLTAQLINAALTRVLVRSRRFGKLATDARLQINSQYIEVLRHLRWYGWHQNWLSRVMDARQHELNVRIVVNCLSSLIYIINILASGIFPVAAFYAYVTFTGRPLRIDIIFPALQLFLMLQIRFMEIPREINSFLNTYVALSRIEEFMAEPEKEAIPSPSTGSPVLKLDACNFAWPQKTIPVLRNITLVVESGLTVVHGKVGSGKTALLQALLGELDLISGVAEIPDEMIAYCSQTPWLQSMSIRDNILFFSPFEEERYQQVLEACALLPDLSKFNQGDRSLIGENGIGLSGGQKARLALARAAYSRSKVLLLDDPLSALDHNTAELIIRKCFSGPLMSNRTIVLVTHRIDLVHHLTTRFVEVADGEITVLSNDPTLEYHALSGVDEGSDSESTESSLQTSKNQNEGVASRKFVEDEHREHGNVKLKVFWTYLKAGKLYWWGAMVMSMIVTRILSVAKQWFFKAWGEAYDEKLLDFSFIFQSTHRLPDELVSFGGSNMTLSSISLNPIDYLPHPAENVGPWLLILLLLSIGQTLALLVYQLVQLCIVYFSVKSLFKKAMERITNATFRYYDVTPIGRLMNRLTADMQTVDYAMQFFGPLIFNGSAWLSSLIVIASVTPLFLVLSMILMAIFITIFLRFLPTSQSLKRLESVSISPLFANFGELIQGVTTVRAFHAQQLFQDRIIRVMDTFQSVDHFNWSLQTWLAYWFENLSAISKFALTAIALSTHLSPGLTAFILLNASNFVGSVHVICRRYGALQLNFISVERIVELLRIEQEPTGTLQPPASWPKFGSDITFENVAIRYADDLDPALTISLHIPGGSTTAIVGRTGSGKSTLASSLLNIVRPYEGTIKIDNVSLADIDTSILRRRVTFVAQDPVLFSGNIRHNLDPIQEHTDEECAKVLDRICFRQGWTLQTVVESGGRNLSQGQRQLVGITRAVLRRSPVIILDEATASIDSETSMQIQEILREEMRESTVITVAHKIEAVKDADYCVVLDNGKLLRQGTVKDVMGDLTTNSEF